MSVINSSGLKTDTHDYLWIFWDCPGTIPFIFNLNPERNQLSFLLFLFM